MLYGQVDQLKLIVIKSKQSTLYHVGDSQHTQNTQINKVIGENEKRAFYFMEKLSGLLGQPNTLLSKFAEFPRRTEPSFVAPLPGTMLPGETPNHTRSLSNTRKPLSYR